jgi:hypothetical protein
MEYSDFIVGEKLFDLGYKYFPKNVKDFNPVACTIPLKNELNSPLIKEDKNETIIIYSHIHHVSNLFKEMRVENPIILVTHNSDYYLDEKLFNSKPNNIIKWYSQNVNVIDPIVESIPIGLENKRWWPNVQKKSKILEKNKEQKNYKNILYMNHSVRTNPKERRAPYIMFGKETWSTSIMGSNGQNFDSYIDNIYNHKFVLCPNGNGVDTHRLWETLYLNSIPIVKESINSNFYKDLPILFVKDWSEITKDYLEKSFEEISSKKENVGYNLDKLKMGYWLNLIKNG